MSESDLNRGNKPRHPMSRWFWGGFFAILLVGVLIAVFASIRGGKQWVETTLGETEEMPQAWTEVIQVILSGEEAVYLDKASVPRIQSQAQAWIKRRQDQAQHRLMQTLDHQSQAIFREATLRLPIFADWYYSLTGEYARLFYAAFGNLPDYLSQRFNQLVFEPAGTAEAIDHLVGNLDARLVEQLHHAARDFHGLLADLVRAHRLTEDQVNIRLEGQWALGTQLAEHLETTLALTPQDIARQGIATSAGAAVSAATVKKLGAVTVAKASTKIASKPSLWALGSVASKLGLKTLAKAGGTLGSAGTGAASGAVLCAGTVVGAPLATGCALIGGAVTGLATWLLVDKAVLETEELLSRETFEAELRQALVAQGDELNMALKSRYENVLQAGFNQLRYDFNSKIRPTNTAPKKDFVPAEAAQQQ